MFISTDVTGEYVFLLLVRDAHTEWVSDSLEWLKVRRLSPSYYFPSSSGSWAEPPSVLGFISNSLMSIGKYQVAEGEALPGFCLCSQEHVCGALIV